MSLQTESKLISCEPPNFTENLLDQPDKNNLSLLKSRCFKDPAIVSQEDAEGFTLFSRICQHGLVKHAKFLLDIGNVDIRKLNVNGDEAVHRRWECKRCSLGGEGNFNWRFIFPFEYMSAEQLVVVSRKDSLMSLSASESRCPPKLVLQVWDKDSFSPDDFIGALEVDLRSVPVPSKTARGASVSSGTTVNLFRGRKCGGFLPCVKGPDSAVTGKVELELELLTAEEAASRPAGRGFEEPNENPRLLRPQRPLTSFLWFTSPFRTMRYILWKHYKFQIILLAVIVVLVLWFFQFMNNLPALLFSTLVGLIF